MSGGGAGGGGQILILASLKQNCLMILKLLLKM
jgi:hypothetical protein